MPDQPSDTQPLSVWTTAQTDPRAQRAGRYVPASTRHPGKMLPAIARHAITHYTDPGDLVLDPMCGIGTTPMEAVHLGRDAIGVEYETHWASVARANLAHATRHGATGHAQIITGDARQLAELIPASARGRVALVLTSPPYGASTHGQVRSTHHTGQPGIAKHHHRYSRDPDNLAHTTPTDLQAALARILASCVDLLRPGGVVAITARPWRHAGLLIDLPALVTAAATHAGLTPRERCVALLAGLRGQGLIPRPSFFQLKNVREARAAGVPHHLIAHEDVLVFTTPTTGPVSG